MKRAISITFVLAIVIGCATAFAPRLRADESPVAAGKPAVVAVTDAELQKMLDNMGFEPTKLSRGYLITIKQDTWTYYIQILLSSNGTKIGFNSNLGVVENPDAVTAEQWKALMISNGDIDPSFFFFDKESKKLYLHRALDNRAIDAAFLRKQIEIFSGNIKGTGALWKFTK